MAEEVWPAVLVGRERRSVDGETIDDVVVGSVPVTDVTAKGVLQRPAVPVAQRATTPYRFVGSTLAVSDGPVHLVEPTVTTEVDANAKAVRERKFAVRAREIASFYRQVATPGPGDFSTTGVHGAAAVEPADEAARRSSRSGGRRAGRAVAAHWGRVRFDVCSIYHP